MPSIRVFRKGQKQNLMNTGFDVFPPKAFNEAEWGKHFYKVKKIFKLN